MFQIQETERFSKWLFLLRDNRAKARILARLDAARLGNLGDVKAIGGGVTEMRIDVGPGSRVYFTRRQRFIVILLCGGDKSTQRRDVESAKRLAQQIE